ncbi:MAG: amidohydrolase family protein [Cytophagales bacterium]|nr:amidohydrolase family protein [Cytophagales bacterium]
MKKQKATRPVFLLLLFLLLQQSFAQQSYIHCGKLIDVVNKKALEKMTIIIDGNKIVSVEKGYLQPKENQNVIDLKDKTILPGLMDMHVHLEGQSSKNSYLESFTLNEADIAFRAMVYAEVTLMAGFTTVRDLGGSGVNIALRNAVNKGLVKGPRIYTAGKALGITGGHADPTNGWRNDLMGDPGPKEGVANGADECRKAVRQQVKNGADLIKIMATAGVLSMAKNASNPQFTEEEIKVIIETAKDFGIKVAAHAHGAEGMKRAIRAGIASIEHGTLMDGETMTLMKKHGTYYVPTITAGMSVADSAKIPGYYPEMVIPKALEIGPKIQATFKRALKAGVKIAYGTDAGVYKHGLNAKEFEFMVKAGMPPIDAIRSATIHAADLLGVADQIGSIEAGKLADIIAVNGNPLDDIKVLQDVSFVMKDGVVYKQK